MTQLITAIISVNIKIGPTPCHIYQGCQYSITKKGNQVGEIQTGFFSIQGKLEYMK